MICPATQSECDCSELNPCLSARPYPQSTTTPSITVGTLVRLTGVVVGPTRKEDDAQGVLIKGSAVEGLRGPLVFIKPDYLEVIRQPFKRGEVVWHGTTELSVLADEEANTVLLVEPMAGAVAFGADANLFERRP